MGTSRLIAIGDVHGCVHALDAVLESIEPTSDDRIVFLGDTIDQGKESREVLERIIALKQECDVVLIQGNHEEMLYAARENERALRYWEHCGGVSTLNSYRFGGTLAEIPAEHWALLDTCVPYYETDDFILTHANYVADLAMAEQPEYTLRWELFDPAKERPHVSGKTVVVGEGGTKGLVSFVARKKSPDRLFREHSPVLWAGRNEHHRFRISSSLAHRPETGRLYFLQSLSGAVSD